jgi:uncharacterized protein
VGRFSLLLIASNGELRRLLQLPKLHVDVNEREYYGRTALHLAALEGHCNVIKTLLDFKADLHLVDGLKNTAFHYAMVKAHDTEAVKLLITAGADVNELDGSGTPALCTAVMWRWKEMVAFLLDCKANVNSQRQGEQRTALHIAAAFGSVEIIKLLLQSQADFLMEDSSFRTPLSVAAAFGQPDAVRMLLAANPETGTDSEYQDNALYYSGIDGADPETVEILMEAGASLDRFD